MHLYLVYTILPLKSGILPILMTVTKVRVKLKRKLKLKYKLGAQIKKIEVK